MSMSSKQFPSLQNDLILRAARGEKVERAPCWVMRQAGRYLPGPGSTQRIYLTKLEFRETRKHYDFFELCETPELACKITLQPIDRYAGLLDAAIIFSDILVIPKAMGMTIRMVEAKGPTFDEPLVTPDDIKRLKETIDIRKDLGYAMDAISLTRRELNGRVPLFGFCGAPWTLLAYMIEGGGSKTLTKAKGWLYKYPQETKGLLQRITDIAIEFLAEQIIAGAQVFPLVLRLSHRLYKCSILGLENSRLPILLPFRYHISFKHLPNSIKYLSLEDTIRLTTKFRLSSLQKELGMLWKHWQKVTITSLVLIGRTIPLKPENAWDPKKFYRAIWTQTYYMVHKKISPKK